MADMTKAEAQRRAHEWLSIEFEDVEQAAAFDDAKRALSSSNPHDIGALIAIGEFRWAREMIPAVEHPASFLKLAGAYFAASADDAFARGVWPRIVAGVMSDCDGDTLRHLVMAAEAVGDRATATTLNDRARTAPDAHPDTSNAITTAVYGMLGYAPDAPKGRLLLRPTIEPDWNRLNVRNVHIGDALIDLQYSREGERMQFVITQVAGAYPVRLIFEPILARKVEKAFVDATPASLDFRPHGDRVIIPVQIMLDERRIVHFE